MSPHDDPGRRALADQSVAHLVFLRHGHALDVDGRCIGHTDVELSSVGANAVRAFVTAWYNRGAASVVGVPIRIVSSDLRRAADSARILALPWRLNIEYDARLREMHFGTWDGRSWQAIEAEDNARLQLWMERWVESPTPGGEAIGDLARRAATWLDTFLRSPRPPFGTTVVVSHAGWIRVALSHLLDRPLARIFDIPVDHARATIVSFGVAGPHLLASNVDAVL